MKKHILHIMLAALTLLLVSSACWAAMVSIGEAGYLEATGRILATGQLIRRWIEHTPELVVLGDPLFVIAFGAPALDIYRVLDVMNARGWSLNGLHRPAAIHLAARRPTA